MRYIEIKEEKKTNFINLEQLEHIRVDQYPPAVWFIGHKDTVCMPFKTLELLNEFVVRVRLEIFRDEYEYESTSADEFNEGVENDKS